MEKRYSIFQFFLCNANSYISQLFRLSSFYSKVWHICVKTKYIWLDCCLSATFVKMCPWHNDFLLLRWWPSASSAVPGSEAVRISTSRAAALWAPHRPLPWAVPNTSNKQPVPPPTHWTPPPLNKALSTERLFSDLPPNKDSGEKFWGHFREQGLQTGRAVPQMSVE